MRYLREWRGLVPQYSTPHVFTPYTELSPITSLLCSKLEDWTAVYVGDNEWSYTRFLQERWDEHIDFINVEHDIVFWPGAIEELWDCSAEWCYYPYDIADPMFPYLGCTKITARLMDKAPDAWQRQRERKVWSEREGQPPWSWCDGWLWLMTGKMQGHIHRPGVVNANAAAWTPCPTCHKNHAGYIRCPMVQEAS